jgi:L-tyrosine peroxygenase
VRSLEHPGLHDLPREGRWDFGGFAYGLEPLVLPKVGAADAAGDDVSPDGYADVCRRLDDPHGDRTPRGPEVEPCTHPDELFWFRWITGHQVSFVVWRLIAQLLDDVDHGRRSPADAVDAASSYVDGYSAMLLYAGSCPRDVYSVVIRPSMRLWHRAFSGSWAPDYWPIRDLVRGRRSSITAVRDGRLAGALTDLQAVHDAVAARLVADGTSLLRQAGVRGPNHRTAGMIYDTYFMTLRGPVDRRAVVTQLLRRVVAVYQDLDANGLYPAGDGDPPAGSDMDAVTRCEQDLGGILRRVAQHACDVVGPAVAPALRTAAAEV